MSDINDIDNVRYSFESQEFFQRQLEQSVNELINKNNTENDKAFVWFIVGRKMAGIKDYSTTASNNTSVGGVSIAEGMLPSNINNAFRAITADIREFYNDSQWVIYGDGDGAHTFAYASGTSFTVAGANVTSVLSC